VLGNETELGAWLAFLKTVSTEVTVGEVVSTVPEAIEAAADFVRSAAAPILNLPKNLLGDLVKATWPFLLIGGAVLGAGIYVAVKHPKVLAGAL
jgi:hypothetical protein